MSLYIDGMFKACNNESVTCLVKYSEPTMALLVQVLLVYEFKSSEHATKTSKGENEISLW